MYTPYSETIKNNVPKITVLDAMMGQGKTQKIISKIQESDTAQKFIYITPLLSEAHRIAGTVYAEDDDNKKPVKCHVTKEYVYTVDAPLKEKRFKHPYFSYKGGKAESLPTLINDRENIVSTHQLFVNLTQDILEGVQDYVLIIDEALSVFEILDDYDEKEIQAMIRNGWLSLDEVDGVTLNFHRDRYSSNSLETDATKDTYYENFATLCDLKQVTLIDNKIIVWELPEELLRAFKEVWIGTYMFDSSLMSLYLKSRGLDYTVEKFGIKPSEIKDLVTIYESSKKGSLNELGQDENALSSSYFKRDSQLGKKNTEKLLQNLDSFFRSTCKAKKDNRLWSGYKSTLTDKKNSNVKKYSKDWLAYNTKATNDYRHIQNVGYLVNIYPKPAIVKAASKKGHSLDRDLYALSEMLQFIFRSAIREGQPIKLYIPSRRMRDLFKQWLNDEFETE